MTEKEKQTAGTDGTSASGAKAAEKEKFLVSELVGNTEEIAEISEGEAADAAAAPGMEEEKRIFRKYRIRDIVFLAVITACTLVTGAVMPLLTGIPVFGIIQLGLGLQFSIFPVIGMMKVRKPGCLLFQALFISIFLVLMFPPMALISLCALLIELLVLLFFRGFKSDWACVFAGTLYMPSTIPFLYLYYNFFYTVEGTEKAAVSMFIGGTNPWVIAGMTAAVLALCFAGSVIGMVISRELRKAGKL